MAIEQKNIVHVAGSVAGATGARVSGSGFTSARTGAGCWTITLEREADATECQVIVTRRGTALRTHWSVEQTSDAVKSIACLNAAGAPLDSDFDFAVLKSHG